MRVMALITGVKNNKGTSVKSGKPYDITSVYFIDSENPSGTPQEMSLQNNDSLLENVKTFDANRLKIVGLNVFQNGPYSNFGGFAKA